VKPAKIEEFEQADRLHEADLKGALPNPNDPSKPNIPAAGAPGQPSVSAAPSTGKDAAKAPDTTTAAAGAPKTPPVDYQLARAVDLLHGVAMFNSHT
jgi:carboxyl-terminal processing protease